MKGLKEKLSAHNKLELFNYYGDFLLLPLVLCAEFYYLIQYQHLGGWVYFSFIMGFIFYGSILEYLIHKYLYHGPLKKIKKLHLIHHKFPRSYVASPPYVTALFIVILNVFFAKLLGNKLGSAFVAGIVLGYFWYVIIHHMIHHMQSEYWYFLNHFKQEHESHHEKARVNYCVSQPFWNKIYRK